MTTELETRFVPVKVIGAGVLPTVALEGVMDLSTGAGFGLLTVKTFWGESEGGSSGDLTGFVFTTELIIL